jgi:hypothetical protein
VHRNIVCWISNACRALTLTLITILGDPFRVGGGGGGGVGGKKEREGSPKLFNTKIMIIIIGISAHSLRGGGTRLNMVHDQTHISMCATWMRHVDDLSMKCDDAPHIIK